MFDDIKDDRQLHVPPLESPLEVFDNGPLSDTRFVGRNFVFESFDLSFVAWVGPLDLQLDLSDGGSGARCVFIVVGLLATDLRFPLFHRHLGGILRLRL